MIGIYKITSPSNRVYIGQSKNIKERFNNYFSLHNCKFQKKLYRSFLKYGVINHTFEVIEECKFLELNEKERYWQEYYNSIEIDLNCFYTKTDEKPRINSQEYCNQISDTLKRKYKNGEIISFHKGKGDRYNIYNFKGDILFESVDMEEIVSKLKLSNRSVINNTLRNNRFLSKKEYIIVPIKEDYFKFVYNCIKINKGMEIPIYQISKDNKIQKCSISSKFRVINKILNSENFIYYSKRNKTHYTFIGLINAVLDSNIQDYEKVKTVNPEMEIPC